MDNKLSEDAIKEAAHPAIATCRKVPSRRFGQGGRGRGRGHSAEFRICRRFAGDATRARVSGLCRASRGGEGIDFAELCRCVACKAVRSKP
jgi:hypothetical protein